MNRLRQLFIKLLFSIVLVSIYPISIEAQSGFESLGFKHNWEFKFLESGFQFISKTSAPIPFSMNGEPQASFDITAYKLDPATKNDILDIMKEEVSGIKNTLIVEEYLEKDFTPKDNIVSYIDTLAGFKIAVIKYRTRGGKGNPTMMPRSIRHVIVLKNNMQYISSLIVLFAEDQDNIREDQMKLIKYIIEK